MSFLQPLALFGLAAASLPTLLHLLGRRLPPIVVFPAVRYLTATEEEHSRRLKLRNIMLLILRTLVIVLLVLGAAHPVSPVGAGRAHPPTAVALVVDNSLSTGAVVAGELTLTGLLDAASAVLKRLGAGDRLWLTTADGIPRRVTRLEAEQVIARLVPEPSRMDLGQAVRAAARVVSDDPLPWKEVVILSDLQSSAISSGEPVQVSLLALEARDPPANRWIDSSSAQPGIWSPDGAVVAAIAGTVEGPTPVRLETYSRTMAQAVASPGDEVLLSGTLQNSGWQVATVELDPDEFRADDRRFVALFGADPVRVKLGAGAGGFLNEALEVLRQGGRVVQGDSVILDDRIGPGVRVVFPPTDRVLMGALNRSLAGQGLRWRYGELEEGEWEISGPVGPAVGTTVRRRYTVVGEGAVIARVDGSPWLVRQDRIVLVGSRMELQWTDLPATAAFIPFVDLLVNRIAAGESWILSATPGQTIELPTGVTALSGSDGPIPVSAGPLVAPLMPGVYFLLGAAADTVGALQVNYDARESRLEAADVATLRSNLGENVRVASRSDLERELFREAERADLAGPFLAAALIGVLIEFALASWLGTTRPST
ncbi:MAG: BatA and WFA domain-containing protein [Gemmatimonadales bacterium]